MPTPSTEQCPRTSQYNEAMELHLTPDLKAQFDRLVSESGYPPEKVIEDAVAAYVTEAAATRQMLDTRYDDLKTGQVKPIDGEAFFEDLRRREDQLLQEK